MISQTAPATPLPDYIEFGILGVVVISMLMGWLWPRPSVDQIRKDKDAAIDRILADKQAAEERATRAETQRDQLARELQTALPILNETTTACRRMLPLLQELIDERLPPRQR